MKSHPILRLIAKTALVVAVLYVTARFVVLKAKLNEEQQKYTMLEERIADCIQNNEQLSDIVNNGINDEYIIKRARSYGYFFTDETIFADIFNK